MALQEDSFRVQHAVLDGETPHLPANAQGYKQPLEPVGLDGSRVWTCIEEIHTGPLTPLLVSRACHRARQKLRLNSEVVTLSRMPFGVPDEAASAVRTVKGVTSQSP